MKMYCVFSKEAVKKMNGNRGKLAAMAGHAFLHAYWEAENSFEEVEREFYRNSAKAYKICLAVDTTAELEAIYEELANKYPMSLVKDAAITVFDEPTVVCLGIGPVESLEELSHLKVFI